MIPTSSLVSSYFQCASCKSIFINPMQSDDDLALSYKEYYTHTAPPSSTPGKESFFRRLKNLINPFSTKRRLEEELVIANKYDQKILEVGCGAGLFLITAKLAYPNLNAYGLDLDPSSYYVSNFPNSFVGSISQFLLQHPELIGSFSLITFNHSIEHLSCLEADLGAAVKLLALNGTIHIETPNSASILHFFLRQDWLAVDPPRHLYIFNKNSLAYILDKVQLRQHCFTYRRAACMAILPLSILSTRPKSFLASCYRDSKITPITLLALIFYVLCLLYPPFSDFLSVKAKKTAT